MPSQGTVLILIFIVAVIFGWMYVVVSRRENPQYKKASGQDEKSKKRGLFQAPNQKPMTWSKHIRPVINWPVLFSDEIQECLPDNKAEAIARYRKQADVDYEKAQNAIEYAIAFHRFVPPPVRLGPDRPIVIPEPEIKFDDPDWDTLLSPTLQACVNKNKQEAIRRYVAVTQAQFKTAQNAVEYYLNHRNEAASHIRIYLVTAEQEKQIREMLRNHQRAEAIQIYQELSGADAAKAISDIDALRKEIMIHDRFENRDPRYD